MEDRIPIPTDNIFKFYALFGLLLFVFCSGSIIYVYHSTNELVFQVAIELETIQQNQNPSPVDKLKMDVLMKRLDIAINDRKYECIVIGFFQGVSVLLMFYGFRKWHKEVQPV